MNFKEKIKNFIFWGFYSTIYHICCLLPLQDKVMFSNFSGKRYGDNPRYISEKLYEKRPDIKQIWQCHYKMNIEFPNYITKVNWPSVHCMYELATSKVWVDSHLKKKFLPKRKGQFFIETWHGGLGFKKIEGDTSSLSDVSELRDAYATSEMADLFISNSKWLSGIYRRAFKYKGKILECGYPKNDIFVNSRTFKPDDIKKRYNISETDNIILYAPTFREEFDPETYKLDFEPLIRAFEERFNRSCVVLVRLHPLMLDKASMYHYSDKVINATDHPDTRELILASDYLITDYSSIIFDFMLTKRPGFIFALDLEKYEKERGLYFKMDEYPFSYAVSNEELQKTVKEFDYEHYYDKVNAFKELTGYYESGNASDQIADIIIRHLG